MSIFVYLYDSLQILSSVKKCFMKTDRRTKYTKMVIQDAFLSLIKDKPIQKVTISDICSLAEISRPTFYLHYEDIYALLDEIGNDLIASANFDEAARLTPENQDEIDQIILRLVHIIQKNIEIYQLCVLERGLNSMLSQKIADELNKTIVAKWRKEGKLSPNLDSDYVIEYLQASFNSVVFCWINRKDKRESPEDVAHIIKTFLINGLMGFVG